MSADALRAAFIRKIDDGLYGSSDGETVGMITHVASGQYNTIEAYKDACGCIRGLNTAKQLINDAYKDLFNPDPKQEENR